MLALPVLPSYLCIWLPPRWLCPSFEHLSQCSTNSSKTRDRAVAGAQGHSAPHQCLGTARRRWPPCSKLSIAGSRGWFGGQVPPCQGEDPPWAGGTPEPAGLQEAAPETPFRVCCPGASTTSTPMGTLVP